MLFMRARNDLCFMKKNLSSHSPALRATPRRVARLRVRPRRRRRKTTGRHWKKGNSSDISGTLLALKNIVPNSAA